MSRIGFVWVFVIAALFVSAPVDLAEARAVDPFVGGCPAEVLDEGAAAELNRNPAARRTIVPAGAVSMRICRYHGFGGFDEQTPETRAKVGRLQGEAEVNGRDLLESLTLEFKELLGAPSGPVSCPADEGAQLYVIFSYREAAPVILDIGLSGCEFVVGATPRARWLAESLRRRLVRLAAGSHAGSKSASSVEAHGVVAYPPPHLTFAQARHSTKVDLEYFCEESQLCGSSSIGKCARKSVKSIGCRYLVTLLSGEVCRGGIRVTERGGGVLTSSPGAISSDEGKCFYLFTPPALRDELEEEGRGKPRGGLVLDDDLPAADQPGEE